MGEPIKSSPSENESTRDLAAKSSPEEYGPSPSFIARLEHERIMHAGPLPAPETLAGYENVLPGASERILRMAESQQGHRQYIEQIAIKGNVRAQTLGVWFAFLLGLAGFGCGTVVILYGHSLEGSSTVIASLAALVGTFVYGRREQRKEREAAEAREPS